MPILRNAKKALRVSKRKALMNQPIRAKLKTMIDKAKKTAIGAVDAKTAAKTLSDAFSAIDRAVKSHIIHRNKAARLKSQLSKKSTRSAGSKPSTSSAASKLPKVEKLPKTALKTAAKKTAKSTAKKATKITVKKTN